MNLLPLVDGANVLWTSERKDKGLASPYYASLRPHLSKSAIEKIESSTIRIAVHLPASTKPGNDWPHNFPLHLLVEEIARIEKKWKLV
jgi:hypothetical protein